MSIFNVLGAVDEQIATHSATMLQSEGPLLDVALHFICENGRECPPEYGQALIDTGADRTAVELSAAKKAFPSGSMHARGVTSDTLELPVYRMRVSFPGTSLPDVYVDGAAGTPHLKGQGLIALIGRDVLRQTRLAYDGPRGEFSIATAKGGMSVRSPAVAYGSVALFGVMSGLLAYLVLKEPPPCKMPETT